MGTSKYVVNADTIASDLLACKNAFEKVDIPWVITDGIVLGYARYKKILEWDTDVDVAVFVEINGRKWNSLLDALTEEEFKVRAKKRDFVYGGRLTPFNLWFFHKKGNFYESFPGTTPGRKFVEKRIWYDEIQMVDFLGSQYPMPNNIDDYLNNHYGYDWPTNIIKDHQEWFQNKRGKPEDKGLLGRSSKKGDLWPKIIKADDTMETN
jgi:hypothetical protein